MNVIEKLDIDAADKIWGAQEDWQNHLMSDEEYCFLVEDVICKFLDQLGCENVSYTLKHSYFPDNYKIKEELFKKIR